MNPAQEKKLDDVMAGIAGLEGQFTAVKDAHERELDNVRDHVGSVDRRSTDRMNRIDKDVAEVRRSVHKPAMLSGGGAGGVVSITFAAIRAFFGF